MLIVSAPTATQLRFLDRLLIAAPSKASLRKSVATVDNATLLPGPFVLQHARLVISIDASPLHLASAVGVPAVALHGPTQSRQWAVISANSCGIDAAHPAAGYMQFGFESHARTHEIMASITVEEVYQAVSALLAATPRSKIPD